MALRTRPVRRLLAHGGLALLLIGFLAGLAHSGLPDVLIAVLQRVSALADRSSASPLAGAAIALKAMPPPAAGTVQLAAHAGAEGHWTFINRHDEAFTVGTPEEMQRVVAALAPDGQTARPKLVLLLTSDTVFERRSLLDELPPGAELQVVVGRQSFAVIRAQEKGAWVHYAIVRPRLQIQLSERDLFDEAMRQLGRTVEKRYVRVLSLEPGGPRVLPRAPAPETATGRPPVDGIDPDHLPAALAALRGQTILISGKVTGELLTFRPASGGELTVSLDVLKSAAAGAGADLVMLQSATSQQPRGRNWFWQRFAIDGLDKALAHTSLDAVLESLLPGREPIAVIMRRQGSDRIVLRAGPPGTGSDAPGDGLGGVLRDVATSITGSLVPAAIEAHLVSTAHRRELALRLVPLVPSSLQSAYICGLALGLVGFGAARRWWRRVWPAERRSDYAGAAGHHAARATRSVAFIALFLPVVGPPAMAVTVGRLIWQGTAMAMRRLRKRPVAANHQPV